MTDEKIGEDTPIKEEPSKEVHISEVYCLTCKERKTDKDFDKRPLGYRTADDGSIVGDFTRCTIFCNKCQTLLAVIDPGSVKEYEDIKKERS